MNVLKEKLDIALKKIDENIDCIENTSNVDDEKFLFNRTSAQIHLLYTLALIDYESYVNLSERLKKAFLKSPGRTPGSAPPLPCAPWAAGGAGHIPWRTPPRQWQVRKRPGNP